MSKFQSGSSYVSILCVGRPVVFSLDQPETLKLSSSATSSFSLSVCHPVSCSYCRGNGMTGFRYRCLRCRGYQLCQNCFWRGNASGSHSNQHQMKEHSSWVSHCVILHSSHQGALRMCESVCVCVLLDLSLCEDHFEALGK